ncbi:MAG: GH3 auxin-responsive promoter family protein [Lachnospiraceae bacterium]|nr:GH3 auxin-responsive promoter family protein [Lachnospiraceae bacterium]
MENNNTLMANKQSAEQGKEVLQSFIEETKDPMGKTTELLMKLLDDNKDTEYGKKYGFADIHSIEDYQKKVPVVVYDDLAPYLERMMDGEKNILTAYEYNHFNETSGTVGVPKVVPMTNEQSEVFAKYNNLINYGILGLNLAPSWMAGRAFCTSSGNCRTLESGLTVGEASAKMADYIKGGKDAFDAMIRTIFTSPIEGLNPVHGVDTKYVHTRFALMEKGLRGIITGFYSVIVLFLRYIEDNYELLIHDIETGTISDEISMPDEVRESLLKKIEPMPERAAELREAFKDGAGTPWVKKVWPEFTYIEGAGGDGFEIYDRLIKEHFTGGGVYNVYSGITASEGLWSVPSGIDDFDSILAPSAAFVEFLPVEAGDDFSKCVTMDKLEEGKVYELIITNLSGFWRYRMSDAVKVTGFANKTPKVQFMYRVNRTINLAEEKTTEKALQVTVEAVAKEMGIDLADFTVYPNTDVTPNRYDFMIEPMYDVTEFDMDALKESVFKHLCEANPVYLDCYDDHWLDKPEVYFLQAQTSLLYRDMMVFRGASLNQLKPVRVIMNERQKKFFLGLRHDVKNTAKQE